ncbi:olfactory receptor 14A16-like [Tachyglossus aculeatus]|uniref:olfactory receptor 14A16-like n=1 Tax=Tachyglossus aculeatus TaxID=9261 RepID=UPI0018F45999|nr:olfactory receptor 14A16-like [Tachyglossus aculeatus]
MVQYNTGEIMDILIVNYLRAGVHLRVNETFHFWDEKTSQAMFVNACFTCVFLNVKDMSNCTTVMELFLLGFSAVQKLQLVHTTLFFLVYLAALMGDLLLDAITTLDRACWKTAATSWLIGGLSGIMHSATISSLPFCGGIGVHQIFCDIPQHMKLSGSEGMLQEVGICTFLTLLSLICFTFIGVSYVHTFRALLNMPSVDGRVKAFSTGLPHLVVVIIFLSMSSYEYLNPPSKFPSTLDLLESRSSKLPRAPRARLVQDEGLGHRPEPEL